MPWLHGDRRGFATPGVSDFEVVAPNQTVFSLGVSKVFEGEGRFWYGNLDLTTSSHGFSASVKSFVKKGNSMQQT
jgi:hypothetical protein